jgi:nucleotide-binding universal stress UspA family protein
MKVLVGIGGADDSLDALEESVQRAVEAGDELTVAVVENPESERDTGELVEAAASALADAGLPEDVRELSGDAGSSLVDLAESEEFDQIVLGGGERSPMGKIKLGHIAEFVLLNARTSVKLVRDDGG